MKTGILSAIVLIYYFVCSFFFATAQEHNEASGGGSRTDLYNIPFASMNSDFDIPVSTATNLYDAPPTTTNSPFNMTVPTENTIAQVKPEFGPSHLVGNNNPDMNYRLATSNRQAHYSMSGAQSCQINAVGPNVTYNRSTTFQPRSESSYFPHTHMFLSPMDPIGLYNGPNFTDDNNENFNYSNHQFNSRQNQIGAIGDQGECYIRNSGTAMEHHQNVFTPLPQTPSLELIKQSLMDVPTYSNLN